MKIIFMGTPEFAVPALKALLNSGEHDVVAVYTQPARPAGRGHKLRNSPICQLLEESTKEGDESIPVFTPTSLKSHEEQEIFRSLQADIAVVSAYGLLLPEAILLGCKYGCINIHPSLLPRWRGAAPIQRQIMAGDSKTAICIMQMDKGLDTGDILLQKNYDIDSDHDAGQLHDKLANESADILLEALEMIDKHNITPQKQSSDGVTYADKLTKNSAEIDFSRTISDLSCFVRGVTPYPGAYFINDNIKFTILKAEFTEKEHNHICGSIIDNKFNIACADGIMHPKIIKRQGKKAMNIDDFLRGFSFEIK